MSYMDGIGPVGRPAGAWGTGAGGEAPDAALFETEAQAARAQQAARTAAGDGGAAGGGAAGGGAAAREVALDLAQLGLDVAGIFDPTPISDGANGIISLGRRDWSGALISGVSMVPYIGDLAKLGELKRLGEVLDKVSGLVRASPEAAAALRKPLEESRGVLDRVPSDKLPDAVREPVQALEAKLDGALDAVRGTEAPPAAKAGEGTRPAAAGGLDGPSGPKGPDRVSKAAAEPPVVSSRDIADCRARIGVPETNTVGVARSNVPGLEGHVFEGASTRPRREGGLPQTEPGPIASPRALPLFRNHAEKDIANQFVAAVERAGLKPSDLDGKDLLMPIQNETGICTACRQGLDNPNVAPGVLKQLSLRYPSLNIHVVVDNPGPELVGSADFVLRNGTYAR